MSGLASGMSSADLMEDVDEAGWASLARRSFRFILYRSSRLRSVLNVSGDSEA